MALAETEMVEPDMSTQVAPAEPADVLAAQVESLLRRVASLETRLEALSRAYRRLPTEVVLGYGRVGYEDCHAMDRKVHP